MNSYAKAISIIGLSFGLAACGDKELCPDSDKKEPIGYASVSQVFNGASDNGKMCAVNAHKLKEGKSYSLKEGILYVHGNLPDNVWLSVDNGKIIIDGDTGLKNRLSAAAPIKTRTVSEKYTCVLYNPALKMSLPTTCSKNVTYFDGYTFAQDTDPSIIINGTAKTGTVLKGNSGYHIRDYKAENVRVKSPDYASGRSHIETGHLYNQNYHVSRQLNL